MKNFASKLFYGKDAKISLLLIFSLFVFVGLGCRGNKSETKPIPPAYLGAWEGQDGSTVTIRGDNSGDYVSGGTKITNGTAEVDEAARTISITMFGLGKTLKIDQPPTGDQMRLEGVTYRRRGGVSQNTTGNDSSLNPPSNTTTDGQSTFPVDDTSSANSSSSSSSGSGDAPSNSEIGSLLKSTLSDFTDAIESEDFTDFHATTSRDFQYSYKPAQLKTAFQGFIDQKSLVVPILRSTSGMSPQFSPAPQTSTQKGQDGKNYKLLSVNGRFATSPKTANFETTYVLQNGDWKLLKLQLKFN